MWPVYSQQLSGGYGTDISSHKQEEYTFYEERASVGDPVTGNHKPIVKRKKEEYVNAPRGDPKRTKTGEYPAQVLRYIYILANPIP
ncbi:hypothetical protein M378DRAFT_18217 [Amanita muscaria Koide BX008]|uniref:Uncharacterized protein n=1 Tax=Amanita muscaria (strain Koide BX008) TaxID=946122 RepID=A0A0C2WEX7_AMAMK|nr:hypothetical protein M378DRAFT_18217 [Amanita muscaria Koide BX008]